MKKVFFSPGPAQLYPTVEAHTRTAFAEQLLSFSHRSKTFEALYRKADEGLRELLDIPAEYRIWFTSSATEAWERIAQNCVEKESFHLVNGSFSGRFFQAALDCGKTATQYKVEAGQGFPMEDLPVPASAELIGAILNETSTGVMTPAAEIEGLKARFPDKLIAVDCVSAFPGIALNLSKVDLAYFSVQKGFGLPAGLGVMIVGPEAFAKGMEIGAGGYHSFSSLEAKGRKFQTPETPNILNIHLLGSVVEDMLRDGKEKMRTQLQARSERVYDLFESHPGLKAFVSNEKWLSPSVLVAEVEGGSTPLIQHLAEKGMEIGAGYGSHKASQIRIANFPAIPEQAFDQLIEEIRGWKA